MSENKSYNFQLEQINNRHIYSFDVDIKKYQIIILPYLVEDGYYKISFIDLNQNIKIKENVYEIKSIIVNIINDFILKNKVKGFVFGLSGSNEKKAQRAKIYQFFLEKLHPNFGFKKSDNIYYINL